jgi:hypothetical protein
MPSSASSVAVAGARGEAVQWRQQMQDRIRALMTQHLSLYRQLDLQLETMPVCGIMYSVSHCNNHLCLFIYRFA